MVTLRRGIVLSTDVHVVLGKQKRTGKNTEEDDM
jgi:hypothetical protein